MSTLTPAQNADADAEGAQRVWTRDDDFESDVQHHREKVHGAKGRALAALAFGTLGIIYGDIGTSPLYAFSSIFPDGAPADDPNRTLGGFSILFWTLTLLVLVKYVMVVLNANDHGEGGTFALYCLLRRALAGQQEASRKALETKAADAPRQGWGPRTASRVRGATEAAAAYGQRWFNRHLALQQGLLAFAVLAVCMVMCDGVLTPAVSVVSAIEGLQTTTTISRDAIVGITCGILLVLFLVQPLGTHRISFMFSPIILLWMLSNAAIGLYNIFTRYPSAWRGLSPHYIYYFWQGDAHGAWVKMGAVLLAVTGCEALYADMGHFSKASIRLGFTLCVYPCLTLTYLGQAALSLQRPEAAAKVYWESIPTSLTWPMLVLATLATIIASQALIAGAFSIAQQASKLHCFPRITIKHTSSRIQGQVYIPEVNFILMVATLAVVLGFQTSAKIGNAYGLAIIIVMLMTTSMTALVMAMCWELHPLLIAAFWLPLTLVEATIFSSTLAKVPQGAWFTLMLSALLFIVCITWHWAHGLKLRYIREHAAPLRSLVQEGAGAGDVGAGGQSHLEGRQLRLFSGRGPAVNRVPGVGIYYNELLDDVSPVLTRFLARIPALHEVVIILTVRSVPIPHVPDRDHLLVRKLAPGLYAMVARYGYMDPVDHGPEFVQEALQEITAYLNLAPGASRSASAALEQQLALDEHANTWHAGPAAAAAAALKKNLELGRTSAPQVESRQSSHSAEPLADIEASGEAPLSATSPFPWLQRPSNHIRKPPSSKSGSSSTGSRQVAIVAQATAVADASEAARVQAAYVEGGATYVLGYSKLVVSNQRALIKKVLLEGLYALLQNNVRATHAAYRLPLSSMVQLGVVYEV